MVDRTLRTGCICNQIFIVSHQNQTFIAHAPKSVDLSTFNAGICLALYCIRITVIIATPLWCWIPLLKWRYWNSEVSLHKAMSCLAPLCVFDVLYGI